MNLNLNNILKNDTYFSNENFELLNEEESLKEYFRFLNNHNESYIFIHKFYHLLNDIFKNNEKLSRFNLEIELLISQDKNLKIESTLSSDFKGEKSFINESINNISAFLNNELQVFYNNKSGAFIHRNPGYYLTHHDLLLSNIKSFFNILDINEKNHFTVDSFKTVYKKNEPHVSFNITGYTKDINIEKNNITDIFERLFKNLLPDLFNKKIFDDAFSNKNNIEYIIFGRLINFPYIMHTSDELIQFEKLRKHCLYLEHAFTDYRHLQAYQITKFLCLNPEVIEDNDLLVLGRVNDNYINDDVHSLYLYPVKYHDGIYEFNNDSFVCKITSTSRGHNIEKFMTNNLRSQSQSLLLDESFFKKNETFFEKILKIQGMTHINPEIIRYYISYHFSLYEKDKIQSSIRDPEINNKIINKRL